MPKIRWKTTKKDALKIGLIADRAVRLAPGVIRLRVEMDLTAAHLNGCKLDLDRLLAADNFNFAHDVFGIEQHMDRTTGKLRDCFVPRFAARSKTHV